MIRKKEGLVRGVFLMICVLLTGIIDENSAMARKVGDFTVQYIKTDHAIALININAKGNINCNGKIDGDLKVKKVVINMSLQNYSASKKIWKNVKEWSIAENASRAKLIRNYHVNTRGKYRVKVSGTMYTSNGSESVSVVSQTKTY